MRISREGRRVIVHRGDHTCLLLALPAYGGANANENTSAASSASSVSSSADASVSDAAVQSAVTLPELDEQKPVVTAEPESEDVSAPEVSNSETTTNTATEKKTDAAPSKTTTSKTDASTSKKTTSSTTTTTTTTGTGTGNSTNTGSAATGSANKSNTGNNGTSAGSTASAPPSSSKTDSGNSNSSNNTSTAAPTDTTPSHTHDWVPFYTSVHHDEVGHTEDVMVEAAYDEPVYDYKAVCSACGAKYDSGDAVLNHIDDDHDGLGSYSVKKVQVDTIHHAAVTEQRYVVDQAAYDEQVLAGYRCSCGATK